ncbi:MAG TPA: S41 family peptidase [Thermoanaerobaculia bacterium]|nr:S41 family peptidase [Thermoanaerobaculia bacterium]
MGNNTASGMRRAHRTGRRRRGRGRSAAALLLCALLGAALGTGFSLDRPRHTDLGSLGWSAAFSRLCELLAREYPFSAWKGLDWAAIEREMGPRVAAAEASRDRRAWYRTLRELVWRLRDGHARLLGDDDGLERAAIGGSFGLAAIALDDGRLLACRVDAGGPAARAGMRFGAELVRWNGAPAAAALAAAPVLWDQRPPATREGLRLAQARMLGRAPVGARATVTFRNRGEAELANRELVAAAAPPAAPPCLRATDLLAGRTVEARALAAGAGYVRIRFELPTLRTPLPGRTLRRALARFAAAGLPGVVVDVRGNCGGMDAMVPPLVAPLLQEAEIYEVPGVYRQRGRFEPDPRQAITVLPRPPLYRGRIAVLIDGDTVSAGEAIPLLLKGLPGVAVIGWNASQGSFGIGLKSVRLPGGLEMVFPHAQSLDADGRVEVDGDAGGQGGVEPDRRLPLTEAAVDRWYGRGEDVVLEAGIHFVRGEEPGTAAPTAVVPPRPRLVGRDPRRLMAGP